jgi:hypothetical protein
VISSTSAFARERRLLQITVALLGFIPVGAGLAGVLLGPAMLRIAAAGASADSHFRYLSGLLLAIGLCYWRLVPTIERAGPAVRLLTLIVVIGGLGRLISFFGVGIPSPAMLGGLVLELLVAPLLWLWQMRVARGYAQTTRTFGH